MKPTFSTSFLGKTLLIVWTTACLVLFVVLPGKASYVQWSNLAQWQLMVGKIGRIDPGRDLISLLQSFTGILVFTAACISLGFFLLRKMRIGNLSNSTFLSVLAAWATAFLTGHGLFSLIFLTVGGLYQLTPIYTSIILFSGFLLGIGAVKDYLLRTRGDMNFQTGEGSGSRRNVIILWLSISIVVLTLLYSTARISYDSSAVYFSDAKLTATTNQVKYFTDDSFVASLFHTVIQFTALIQLFGDQAARMLSWVFGLCLIIFSLALGERIGLSKLARVILLTLLVTSTAFLDLMSDGKVDLMSSAPALAGIYWLVVEAKSHPSNRSLLLLSGFLLGLAIIARPFNAFLAGLFVLLFYLQRAYVKKGFQSINTQGLTSAFLWISVCVLGLGVFHLFANWMILGDPIAFITNVSKINPSAGPWDFNADQILAIRLLYPFVATFYNSPQTLGNISPFFLAFVPALFIQDIRRQINFSRELKVLLVISLVTLAAWIFLFFTVYEIRYVLFLWIILYMPAAEVIAVVLKNKDAVLRDLSSVLITILLIFFVVRTVYISLDTYSPIDQQGNPQCFCDSLAPINEAAARGDRVLTLSAYRYYLRSDLFACSTQHDEYRKLDDASRTSTETFWLEVYRQGYTYISFEIEYTTKHLKLPMIPSPENAPEWLRLQPLYTSPGGTHIAYRIEVENPPSLARASCTMNAAGIWEVGPDQ